LWRLAANETNARVCICVRDKIKHKKNHYNFIQKKQIVTKSKASFQFARFIEAINIWWKII